MVTKTIKLGVHREMHEIKRQAIFHTQTLYNRVIAFYMDFFVAHLSVFDDLGVNRLAVMGAFVNHELIATKFIHGGELNHKRHMLLNAINNKRAQSGRLQAGVQDNQALWDKVGQSIPMDFFHLRILFILHRIELFL